MHHMMILWEVTAALFLSWRQSLPVSIFYPLPHCDGQEQAHGPNRSKADQSRLKKNFDYATKIEQMD
jgi:hypothetical protein